MSILKNIPEISLPTLSVTMAHLVTSCLRHSVALSPLHRRMSPLIFREPAIMLAVALAKDLL